LKADSFFFSNGINHSRVALTLLYKPDVMIQAAMESELLFRYNVLD